MIEVPNKQYVVCEICFGRRVPLVSFPTVGAASRYLKKLMLLNPTHEYCVG